MLGLIGIVITGVLLVRKIQGGFLIGIIATTLIGIPLGVTQFQGFVDTPPSIEPIFMKFDFSQVFTKEMVVVVFTFLFIDMFDTIGTLVGTASRANMLDKDGNMPGMKECLMADAVGTMAGACLGTSTVTTFVESGAGVSAGGRTGLTAFTTACMFFLALFAMPLFAAIPSAATASALIYVGVLMMKNNVKSVDFSNAINATAAFLTMVVMILSYSITKGIGVGMIAYTVMSAISYLVELVKYAIDKKEKPVWKVSVVAIVVTVLFAVYFFVPVAIL